MGAEGRDKRHVTPGTSSVTYVEVVHWLAAPELDHPAHDGWAADGEGQVMVRASVSHVGDSGSGGESISVGDRHWERKRDDNTCDAYNGTSALWVETLCLRSTTCTRGALAWITTRTRT